MDRADLELVRRFFADRQRGVFNPEMLDPDVRYSQDGADVPDFAGHWRGIDEMRAAAAGYRDVWESLRYELVRIVDLGERVLVVERHTGRGKGSGVELAHDLGHLLVLRSGRIVRWDAYWNPADVPRPGDGEA